MYYIGVDLGTSAVKLILMAEDGSLCHIQSCEYPLFFPENGWSEQNPADWWNAVVKGIHKLCFDISPDQVAGISFGGQMHGLVALDASDQVIRPAILWNDGRTEEETRYLNEEIGTDKLAEYTGNIAFAGFTAPKLLWMQKHEPELFARIRKIMLPKDYLCYRMTGVHATDYSDAAGTLLLDVKNKCWSQKMLDLCHIRKGQMPALYESYEVVGTLLPDTARELGLSPHCKVMAGASDNAAAAIGTGTVGDGTCNISLGTSGTIFIPSTRFHQVTGHALHSFNHADGSYHLMGCILSAASCNKWWMENILNTDDFGAQQKPITELGKNTVYFLPYLMGERSPHNDPQARGAFLGLSLDTPRHQLTQAIFEGVAFALQDCYQLALEQGIRVEQTSICGGGAKSPLWRKIVANILDLPVVRPVCEEGPGFGAAILSTVGCGQYASVKDAVNDLVHFQIKEEPDPSLVALYREKYENFKEFYPALKGLKY